MLRYIKKPIKELLVNDNIFALYTGQRKYVWGKDEIIKLIQDIKFYGKKGLYINEGAYVKDTIQTQKYGTVECIKIYDSFQRLTTLTLILANIRIRLYVNIKKYKNEIKLIEKVLYSNININGNKFVMLSLSPMFNDNQIYENLVENIDIDKNSIKTIFDDKLINANNVIERELRKYSDEELIDFLHNILENVTITLDNIPEHLVHTKFNTINNCRINLTTLEMLKDYLFTIYTEDEKFLDLLAEEWYKLQCLLEPSTIRTMGKYKINVNKFLRHYILSKADVTCNFSKKNIYNWFIKLKLNNKEDVLNLVKDLLENAKYYIEYINNYKRYECILNIRELGHEQSAGVFLAAYNLEEKQREEIIGLLEKIAFCFIFSGLNPNKQTKIFIDVIKSINDNNINNAKKILKDNIVDLKKLTLNSILNKVFNIKNYNDRKKIRCILTLIGNRMNDKIDEYETFEIEHILPQEKCWQDEQLYGKQEWYKDDNFYNITINKLGNFTYLEKNDNNKLGNNTFLEKIDIYTGYEEKCALTYLISGNKPKVRTKQINSVLEKHPYYRSEKWGKIEIDYRSEWLVSILEEIIFD